MSDASPSPTPAPHVVGEGYEFDEVRAFLGGDPKPPNFVIHKGTEVIGVCLGLGWNPRADGEPCEVWVGRKGDQPKWGIKLAETRGIKVVALHHGVDVCQIAPTPPLVTDLPGTKGSGLARHNVSGGGNDEQIRATFDSTALSALREARLLVGDPARA